MRTLIGRALVALGDLAGWFTRPIMDARWEAEGKVLAEEEARRDAIRAFKAEVLRPWMTPADASSEGCRAGSPAERRSASSDHRAP